MIPEKIQTALQLNLSGPLNLYLSNSEVNMKSLSRCISAAVLAAALICEGTGAAHASTGTPDPTVASPADPATDPADLALAVPLSSSEVATASQRQAAATQFYETGKSSVNPMTLAPTTTATATATNTAIQPNSLPDPGSLPTSATLTKNQQTQVYDYWCGPAAVLQAILTLHPNSPSTQSGLASNDGGLKTTTDGTAWSGIYVTSSPSTGHPVPDILNNRLSGDGADYQPVGMLGETVSGTVKSTFKADVTGDVANGWPVVPNIDILSGGARPAGYPSTGSIQHWVTIYGYSNSAGDLDIEDPAGGLGGSWSGLAKYWTTTADNVLSYIDQRGYVW